MKLFIATPDGYHTQRNNRIDPVNTCNVTAMVNALKASKVKLPVTKEQPEDYLAQILNSQEAHEKLTHDYPQMASLPPREVHGMLSWAVNEKFIGHKVTTFSTNVSLAEILYRVARRGAASVISTTMTTGGHLVAVVGFSTRQDLATIKTPADVAIPQVRRIYLLDSWGDWTAVYEPGSSGFGYGISVQEFSSMAKPINSERKWAHLFSPEGIF